MEIHGRTKLYLSTASVKPPLSVGVTRVIHLLQGRETGPYIIYTLLKIPVRCISSSANLVQSELQDKAKAKKRSEP